jgi:hypothetical protein
MLYYLVRKTLTPALSSITSIGNCVKVTTSLILQYTGLGLCDIQTMSLFAEDCLMRERLLDQVAGFLLM